MAYNGALLARAREKLAARREANGAERARRLAEVYARSPRIKDIDRALRAQMVQLMGLAISHGEDVPARVAELERANLALQGERAARLAALGLPEGYTDEIYSCPLCHDTGVYEGGVCSCLKKLYNRELTAELGTLLRTGGESFAAFDPTLYSAELDAELGASPREYMLAVKDACQDWARSFAPGAPSLLFMGGTGLGKTFMSACVARVVAAAGYSVAYEGTAAALAEFEHQKFSRDAAEADAAGEKVKNYLECDLMILDDLGTEMATSFSTAALYQLINTRLAARRSTVISTNLDFESLRRRYGAQIASRLEGEYTCLPFRGRDIRLVKKEREA